MSAESIKEKNNKLDLFGAEIERIKEKEMLKKKEWEENNERGEAYEIHFDEIDPEELTEEDCDIYNKFKDDTLTLKGFLEYEQSILETFKGKGLAVEPTAEDRAMYEKFKAENITRDEWLDYWQERVKVATKNDKDKTQRSRENFHAWLSNKITTKEWRDKFKKEKEAENKK